MSTGTVKFFDANKGFGFIEQTDGQPDVFVHVSAVERSELRTLVEGQKISFDIVRDSRSGKNAADNLRAA
jgi:cold shock protein